MPTLSAIPLLIVTRMSAFLSFSSARSLLFTVATGLLLAFGSLSHAADTVPSEVLVKLQSAAVLPSVIVAVTSVNGVCPGTSTSSSQFGSRPIYRLKLAVGCSVDAVVARLLGVPVLTGVLLAEANTTNQSPEARRGQPWTVGTPSAYTAQWAPTAMHLPAAHRLTKGAGVKVAVLDTGVDLTHPALAGKLLPGYDFVDGDSNPSEELCAPTPCTVQGIGFGHGTHVAGLIALVAPLAKIIPYRVLDPNGEGNAWVLAEALQQAVTDGADVINMSLGTQTRTRILESITKLFQCEASDTSNPELDFSDASYVADRTRCTNSVGPVIVAAAGNDASSNVNEYPAAENVKGLISVGASNDTQHLASFSNFGSWVQIAAPGEGITSSVPITAANPGGYGTWSGTSMAAPLVAGAAALLRSIDRMLPPRDLVRRLQDLATPLQKFGGGGTNISQVDVGALGASVQVCQMDIDGDGQILTTTDGLILMRAMMGMSGTAVSSAAAPGSPRSDWLSIRAYLVGVCGMTLP
jgi:subtilisin family serine protease